MDIKEILDNIWHNSGGYHPNEREKMAVLMHPENKRHLLKDVSQSGVVFDHNTGDIFIFGYKVMFTPQLKESEIKLVELH